MRAGHISEVLGALSTLVVLALPTIQFYGTQGRLPILLA